MRCGGGGVPPQSPPGRQGRTAPLSRGAEIVAVSPRPEPPLPPALSRKPLWARASGRRRSGGGRARKGSGVSACVMPPARRGWLGGKTPATGGRSGHGDGWECGPSLPLTPCHVGPGHAPFLPSTAAFVQPWAAAQNGAAEPLSRLAGGCRVCSPRDALGSAATGPPQRDFHFIFKYLDSAVLICFLVSILILNTRRVGGVCFRW